MSRREFIIGAAALALAGCSQPGDKPITITDVIAEIKKQCSFLTDWEPIAKVIATVIAGFNPEAGAATVIASAVAKTVVDMVCNAVKVQMAQMSVQKKGAPSTMVVIVNGVEVTGAHSAA